MLSRRDKLLVRPWEQRRYENHRRKVHSASAAIDNRSPQCRDHIELKLKKHQKETERCDRIEKDNLNLLRRLGYIMRTNRVDNYWNTPAPNFLNRVGIYDRPLKDKRITVKTDNTEDLYKNLTKPRKAKCTACSPQKQETPIIPEERIPWEPDKPSISRVRSKSVPSSKISTLLKTHSPEIKTPPKSAKTRSSSGRGRSETRKVNLDEKECQKMPQSITLSRGSLVLAVNFPSDTLVKFHEGSSEKFIMRGTCHCRNVIGTC